MSIEQRSAEIVASWFGCGRSPVAPGTVGSIGAVPLHFLLSMLGPVPYWTSTIALTLLGTWAAERVTKDSADKDPQWVVIDEVAGTLIAMGLVRHRSIATRIAALVLFRAFDIVKPGIINRAQDLEPAGVGVMADDVLAGIAAGIMARWL